MTTLKVKDRLANLLPIQDRAKGRLKHQRWLNGANSRLLISFSTKTGSVEADFRSKRACLNLFSNVTSRLAGYVKP